MLYWHSRMENIADIVDIAEGFGFVEVLDVAVADVVCDIVVVLDIVRWND